MSAQDDMLHPLVDHTMKMVARQRRAGDLLARYCIRLSDISLRFDEVLARRMQSASVDAKAALVMGTLTAKIEYSVRQAEDLRVWLEAQRVLGRTP